MSRPSSLRPRTLTRLSTSGAAFIALAAMLGALGPTDSRAQEGYSASEFSVVRRDREQIRPRMSENIVVWQDYRNLGGASTAESQVNADIYGRIVDGDDFKVTDNHTAARPAISGSRVVYTDSRRAGGGLDIRGYNLQTGDVFDVAERNGDQDYAAISGAIVVWQDNRSGNWDIRGRDVARDDDFNVIVRDGDQRRPAISGTIVAWEDYRRGAGEPDIYYRDVSVDDDPIRVTDDGDARDPAVSGDWIVYRTGEGDSQRVRLYNRSSRDIRNLTERVRLGGAPRISGNLVVWADRRNDEDHNIWGHDIAANVSFRISGADGDQTSPDISGQMVVWEDYRGDDPRDIRGARLTAPTAATPTTVPAPPVAGPIQQGPCFFTLGFKLLRDQIPNIVGDCRENEWHNAFNGDGLQQTTGGLLVWRKADNWTAFTNGSQTWLNGPCGMQTRPNEGPFYAWEGRVGAGCI